MTVETKQTVEERKPYEKPEIRRVQLQPEESLAASCKVGGMSASMGSVCIADTCFSDGS